VVAGAAERGFVIGGGYGALKQTTFRIGHMGDHTTEGLARCLAACRDALGGLR
jgi:aspartate aminotransferase-like enzyme